MTNVFADKKNKSNLFPPRAPSAPSRKGLTPFPPKGVDNTSWHINIPPKTSCISRFPVTNGTFILLIRVGDGNGDGTQGKPASTYFYEEILYDEHNFTHP